MKEKKLIINSSNNPFSLFKEWFDEAQKNEINDANAMNLSTISKSNFPSSRMVLLKDFDDRGFVFYTKFRPHHPKSSECCSALRDLMLTKYLMRFLQIVY